MITVQKESFPCPVGTLHKESLPSPEGLRHSEICSHSTEHTLEDNPSDFLKAFSVLFKVEVEVTHFVECH